MAVLLRQTCGDCADNGVDGILILTPMNIANAIKTVPQPLLVIFYIAVIFLFMVFDIVTGPDFSFLVFYLLPILMAAWFSGRRIAYAMAVAGAAAWIYADVVSHTSYSHPLVPFWNVTVKFSIFLIAVEILSRLRETLDKEKQLARKDELTGAANRRAFYEAAQIEIDRMHRYKHPFTLVYIDLDNFKAVNDAFGHQAGDRVLKIISAAIMRTIRSTDIFARIGGDEFVVLLAETGKDQAGPVVGKVHAGLIESMRIGGWPVTFSIGAMTYLRSPGDVDALVKKGDDLMYAAKRDGKNRINFGVWKESASVR
jgi:diguanylate cyclase (GGDEF)-like protein